MTVIGTELLAGHRLTVEFEDENDNYVYGCLAQPRLPSNTSSRTAGWAQATQLRLAGTETSDRALLP
jgi:hypothetical protein